MKCSEVHLAIGAEPQHSGPELEQHLRECAACADYRREMLLLDEEIRRALSVDVTASMSEVQARPPVRLVSNPSPAPARASWVASMGRHWALAASVMLAVVVAGVLWGALPRSSLAADVVAHVVGEPLPADEKSVPLPTLDAVLRNAHLRLDPLGRDVLFAQTCFFRGRLVPHFVVRSGDSAVTVLVLLHEPLRAPQRFTDNGYSGILLPNAGHGSIAVLSRNGVDFEREAREILSALHSQPAA